MATVLDDINAGVREDMEARKRLVSLAELKDLRRSGRARRVTPGRPSAARRRRGTS